MTEQNWDMYDYILESTEAVRNIVKNREQIFSQALAYLEGRQIDQIYILGSGTSYHSAVASKKLAEDVLGRKVINMYPMEFVDNEKVFNKNTLVIGISHAGRSSSTIAALDKAAELGLCTISMTAEKERPITDHADANVYIEIGDEFAGPKTKGFIGSIATIQILAMMYAKQLGLIDEAEIEQLTAEMLETTDQIPEIADQAWAWYRTNREDLLRCRRMIVLGYDACMAAMLEGTLKILEAVRYSVTGYELEEFMHGVYHSIDENTYMLYLGMTGRHYDRMRRMKTYFANERHAHNYEVTSETGFGNDSRNFVFPFRNHEYFAAMEYVIPCQVIARKMSLDLGIDCNISSDPEFHKKMGSYTY